MANHAINPRPSRKQVRAVELKHFLERNLAGPRRLRNRRIGEFAAFAQGQKTRRQPYVSHGYSRKVSGAPGQLQKANAVGDGLGLSCNLHGIYQTMPRDDDVSRQVWGAFKIMNREQDPRGHGIGAQEPFRQLAESFHLDIAPLAARVPGLGEPVELAGDISCESAAPLFAAASGKESGACGLVLLQPAQELGTLGIAFQPIEACFDGPRASQSRPHLAGHFRRRRRRCDRTNPPDSPAKESQPPTPSCKLLKRQLLVPVQLIQERFHSIPSLGNQTVSEASQKAKTKETKELERH